MTYSPFRHIGSVILKNRPIHLTLFLTRHCNARCPFCFYLKDRHRNAVTDAQELDIGEIEKISQSAGNLLWLAFSGGEIFLREDLPDIAHIFYRNNKPSIILLPTNGLLTDRIASMTEDILRSCPKSTVVVKLSIEGTEEVHDSLRGSGSFTKTMDTFHRLRELIAGYPNFELGINTVICSANSDEMENVIEYINRLNGVKTHTISLARGDIMDEKLKEIAPGRYAEIAGRLAADHRKRKAPVYRFRGAKLKAAQDILQRRLILETMKQRRQVIPCVAGRLSIVITENGDLFPCETFSMKIANTREDGYDIRRILSSEKAQKVLGAIRRGECHCTHECYLMMSILFNPVMYPALMREYLRLH
jgi:radical SAM protein with 4Fe4S-binding SPASM domain